MRTEAAEGFSSGIEVLDGGKEQYEVERPLGRGGFGVTHLARRRSDDMRVVVKRLRMERLDDWKTFDLFEREAKVLESLRHPNIPAFVDHFELREGESLRGFALVQTYVEGQNLGQLDTPPPATALHRWFERLLEICQFLHERTPPVIHRDITPKNIMIRASDGDAVLIDFGAVQNGLRSADTVASTSAGTFGYAAPEQLIGRAVPASDLYGLAMTYLAVATGKEPEALPYAGNRIDVSASLHEHDTHPRLALLLETMSHPDPGQRPASAADVLAQLRSIPRAPALKVAAARVPQEPEDGSVEQVWRDRLERSSALGDSPYRLREIPDVEDFSECGLSDTGELAIVGLDFMEGGVAALDLETFTLERWRHEVSGLYHGKLAIEVDGRGVLLVSFDKGAFMRRGPDRELIVHAVSGLPMMMGHGGVGRIALAPDGKTLACLTHDDLVIVDLASGRVAQTISLDRSRLSMSGSVRYAPDGSALLLKSFGDTGVVTPGGETEMLDDQVFAIANDGRTVACADGKSLRLGVVERWAPFAWKDKPRRVVALHGRLDQLRFSPDDCRIAFVRDGRVGVVDLERSELAMTVGDPYRPGLPLRTVEHAGFSRDGRRLLVSGKCFVHPLATERDDCLAVYSVERKVALGTVLRLDDTEVPYGFTVFGVHGKLSGNKKKGRQQGERTRRLLLGERPQEVLGDAAAAALDFADRLLFWGAQVGDEGLTETTDLTPLVEASAGLTGLLPVAVQRAAREAADQPARFGQPSEGGGEAGMLDALAWLRGKNEAERQVLFEDMLPGLVADAEQEAEVTGREPRDRRRWIFVACAVLFVLGVVLPTLLAK